MGPVSLRAIIPAGRRRMASKIQCSTLRNFLTSSRESFANDPARHERVASQSSVEFQTEISDNFTATLFVFKELSSFVLIKNVQQQVLFSSIQMQLRVQWAHSWVNPLTPMSDQERISSYKSIQYKADK